MNWKRRHIKVISFLSRSFVGLCASLWRTWCWRPLWCWLLWLTLKAGAPRSLERPWPKPRPGKKHQAGYNPSFNPTLPAVFDMCSTLSTVAQIEQDLFWPGRILVTTVTSLSRPSFSDLLWLLATVCISRYNWIFPQGSTWASLLAVSQCSLPSLAVFSFLRGHSVTAANLVSVTEINRASPGHVGLG